MVIPQNWNERIPYPPPPPIPQFEDVDVIVKKDSINGNVHSDYF